MRKLMWFTIGTCIGIAASIWFLIQSHVWIVATVLVLLSLLLGLIHPPGNFWKIIAVCMVGASIGACWFHIYTNIHVADAKACDGQYLDLEIRTIDFGEILDSGSTATGEIKINGSSYKVIFYIDEQIELVPGDIVSAEFYIRFTGFGGSRSSTYHQGEGIYLLAYAHDSSYVFHKGVEGLDLFVPKLRQNIKTALASIFPNDAEGFAQALLLGDSSGLSISDDYNFQNSGIRHIIAVSGLHITILFAFVRELLWNKRWLNALIGIPVLILFAALAGFTPSVLRACIMQAVLICSYIFDREYDSPTALSAAVLIILGMNPLAITSVSFQLSVGCVIGIQLFSTKIHQYIISRKWLGEFKGKTIIAKIKRWAATSISTSISAVLLTTPLSAYYFGTVCTVGILTNLLTLWAIAYIFCGIIICLLLSLIYIPISQLLAIMVSWLMRYVLGVSAVMAKIPYSAVSADNIYIVAWLLFAYMMLIIMIFSKEKRPFLLSGCILLGLSCSLFLSWLEVKQEDFRMTVLDVGQGQCIILQSGNGCYIVDCGGSSGAEAADLAVRTLRTQCVNHVDGLIITHYDKDHVGGVEYLMSEISVGHLYLPDVEPNNTYRLNFESQYPDKIEWIGKKRYISFENADITLIPGDSETVDNNSSMCILFQTEDCDILITGDLQAEGEKRLLSSIRLPEIEILVAGHHGSKDSTSMRLLNVIKPAAVVISVARNNSFAHPSAETLHRLELFGCRVWRTDLNGTVVFRG